MPRIQGFRSIEYRRDGLLDRGTYLSPPYDVLSEKDRDRLLENNPHNAVALDLITPGPTLDSQAHRQSKILLDRWLREGILRESDKPRMLILEDRYLDHGIIRHRTGLLCTVGLEKLGGSILPHERVLSTPIQDRLGLLRETQTHFSPIFFVCDDPQQDVLRDITRLQSTLPCEEFSGIYEGLSHRLWIVEDPKAQSRLSHLFSSRELLIADGHHRYQTAYLYSQEHLSTPDAANMLSFISFFPSEGLSIHAFHRIAQSETKAEDLLRRLSSHFTYQECPLDWNHFEPSAAPMALLAPDRGALYLLQPRKVLPVDAPLATIPSVMLNFILKEFLSIDLQSTEQQKKVAYFFDREKFTSTLSDGGLGFWLKPASIGDVFAAARSGFVLPQKSTYFYPKVPTGIAFHRIQS